MSRSQKQNHTMSRPLLTVAEVAALDNCSEKTVRRAIDGGQLDALRMGPSGEMIRIDPDAHKAYRSRCRG